MRYLTIAGLMLVLIFAAWIPSVQAASADMPHADATPTPTPTPTGPYQVTWCTTVDVSTCAVGPYDISASNSNWSMTGTVSATVQVQDWRGVAARLYSWDRQSRVFESYLNLDQFRSGSMDTIVDNAGAVFNVRGVPPQACLDRTSGDVGDIVGQWDVCITYWTDDPAALTPVCEYPEQDMFEVLSGVIDASAEDGVEVPLQVGRRYYLVVGGGPWNDGSTDRTDVAYSFDQTNWNIFEPGAFGECATPAENGIGFTAEGSSIWLRVNDQDGQFGDNTGEMEYTLYLVAGACERYFTNESYLVTGVVFSDAENGVPLPPSDREPYRLTPGTWYKLEVMAPWTEGADGQQYYDLQIRRADASSPWVSIGDWSGTGCTDGENHVYYLFAEESLYWVRVADKDGNWSNNSGSALYNLSQVEYRPPPNPCEGLYTLHNWMDAPVIQANADNGTAPSMQSSERLEPGQYYMLEQVGAPWLDGDVERYDFEVSDDHGQTWYRPEDWPAAQCISHDADGRKRIYFLANSTLLYLRTHDWDGDRSNNSGLLAFNIYNAADNRPPEDGSCSSEYTLVVDPNTGEVSVVEAGSIPANDDDGEVIGSSLVPDSWYAIEASVDYWQDSAAPRAEADIGQGGEWWLLQNYPGAACAELIDTMYVRMYFRMPHDTLRLRAHDPGGNYEDNTDFVTYRIYPVHHQEPPPPSACWEQYDLRPLESGYVYASLENGQALPIQESGLYAVEIVEQAYYDNGLAYYDADISDDAGETWYPLEYAPFARCIVPTGSGVYRIYFEVAPGQEIRLRARDHDQDYGNNSGTLGYILFAAEERSVEPGEPPPAEACESLFPQAEFVGQGVVDADDPDGARITGLLPGHYYRIETLGPAWMNGSSPSYEADISNDGGTQWNLMDPDQIDAWGLCGYYTDGAHVRVYIQVEDGQSWRLRAHDPGGDYTDNEGQISYLVWKVNYQEPVEVGPPPPDFGAACSTVCYRPDSALNVPAWLEYGRCRLVKWLAWCPHHGEALASIEDNFWQREPFATLAELRNILTTTKTELAGQTWSEGMEDPMGGMGPEDIMDFAESNNPFFGGEIQLLGPGIPYSEACDAEIASVIGPRLGQPVCFVLAMAHGTGFASWLQLFLDLSALLALVVYLWNAWIQPLFD